MTHDRKRTWLQHWHSVIDEAFGQDPEFSFEAASQNPDRDFRMHFMTWDLSDEQLQRCFQVLPLGDDMCERAIEMRALHRASKPISEQHAVELFRQGLHRVAQFVQGEDLENLQKPIQVKRGKRAELPWADPIRIAFEGVEWNLKAEVEEARWFIGETLYRLAHHYDVVDYIEWPLFPDPQSVDPHRPFALLAITGSYFSFFDAAGPVLYVATDRLPASKP